MVAIWKGSTAASAPRVMNAVAALAGSLKKPIAMLTPLSFSGVLPLRWNSRMAICSTAIIARNASAENWTMLERTNSIAVI